MRSDEGLVTGEAVEVAVRPAGFGLRALGAAIDVAATAALLALAVWGVLSAAPDEATARTLTILVVALLTIVAPAVVETVTRGRSLGRLVAGTRVVRDDGGSVVFRHAFVRALLGVVELYLTLGGLAALVGLLSPRSKRVGDHLAGTFAILERVRRPNPTRLAMPPELAEWARTADAGRLPDALARRVSGFLANAPGMLPDARRRLAGLLASEVAPFVRPVSDGPPEAFLAAVAVLRRDREAAALAGQDAVMASLAGIDGRSGIPDRG